MSAQGSSRSGKTYNIVLWIIIYCLNHPRTTVSIVRATLPALKGSVYRDFVENMTNLGIWSQKSMNKNDFIYTFPNGSWIEFFSCDSEQKMRGRKRKILYVNEGNELLFIQWQQLQMRTTEFSIIDYNPSFTDEHWICTLNQEPRTYHFISTYKENPFLERKVVDEIESLQYKNESLWRIYGLGMQAIVEGLVFTNVEYVDGPIPEYVKHRYRAVDYGYEHDPTAIVDVGIFRDEIWVDEDCYQTHLLTSEIIKILKGLGPNTELISESAEPRMIAEIQRAGINIHPVVKFPGSVQAGIMKMLEYKIKITRRSTNVKKEFSNYTWQQNREGKWLNEPIDAFNHAIDAIRYVVIMKVLGGKPRPVDLTRLANLAH